MSCPAELWRHPNPGETRMGKFMDIVNAKHSLSLKDYRSLHQWSVENPAWFWAEVWSFVGIKASKKADSVLLSDAPIFPRPDFFHGALLNFAENLLYPHKANIDPSEPAVFTVTEKDHQAQPTTWLELREAVRCCSNALRTHGLKRNQVVAGFVSNHAQALVAMLAASSIGALWTSISPDNGVSAVLDRLSQIKPSVLFVDNGMVYNGKTWPTTGKALDIVKALAESGLELVVVIENVKGADLGIEDICLAGNVKAAEYETFLLSTGDTPLVFEQLPPSHPLYILYSSGTTGLPKAIVHTALGTLIQHKKEHVLHCSLGPQSRMLYYTTTSWMMWHWSISALATGASLVLYTGSPFRPHSHLSMPIIMSELKVTHFGTSAAYLTALETNKVYPRDSVDLSSLEAVYSTASPLPPSTFSFIYDAFPRTVNLGSITGGTDIISLFGAPCPLLPVHVGEIQCIGLGMAVTAVDPMTGEPVEPGEEGDLVCTVPFPCQPLTFLGPDGDDKYKASYFSRFPGVWHHGDFVRLNPKTGGLVMLGRSDGVLKPAGVRFGSAEIYNILTKFFSTEVEDAVCVGRRRPDDRDEAVCLFMSMVDGKQFGEDLRKRICGTIRSELSPRHVPRVVEEAKGGIPKTMNGKKIEVAVKQILSGRTVVSNASVQNPEALEWFRDWTRTDG
ncbi:uncharacterized protein MKZ38_003438 [Zalerion maritima]|uniref:Acetoacetyl-CoA synthetase n=1 Tax=Zalerion maritima TaxID=339359 RepID=A0AAD5WRR1_9PEZI|nr:uncharacterized protein MKZ38_003438 [Zalerion maritima]